MSEAILLCRKGVVYPNIKTPQLIKTGRNSEQKRLRSAVEVSE